MEPQRLQRLESKVDRLMRLCLLQTVVVTSVCIHYLLSHLPLLLFFGLLALPLAYLMRRVLLRAAIWMIQTATGVVGRSTAKSDTIAKTR